MSVSKKLPQRSLLRSLAEIDKLPWEEPNAELKKVDFAHWGALQIWCLREEAVTLSLGKNPKFVTLEKMRTHWGNGHAFAEEHDRRDDIIARSYAAGKLGKKEKDVAVVTVTPSEFVSWVHIYGKKYEIDCPQALIDEVKKAGHEIKRPQKQSKTKAKPGRKDKYDWPAFREKLFALLEYHGNPVPGDPKWSNPTAVVSAMADWCDDKWDKTPCRSTLYTRVQKFTVERSSVNK